MARLATPINEATRQRIKRLRGSLHLQVSTFAMLCGISSEQVRLRERGRIGWRDEEVQAVRERLEIYLKGSAAVLRTVGRKPSPPGIIEFGPFDDEPEPSTSRATDAESPA